jgi:hypothetical protein
MKMGINFTNAQLFVAGLILIGIAFLSIGLFPATIINNVNYNEVGVIQYEEGTGVKQFNILEMTERYGAETPEWLSNNKYYSIDGYQMVSTNNNPPVKSLIITIPNCGDKVVLKNEGGSQSKIVTTCSLGTYNGVQQRLAFKVLGFQSTSTGKAKWNVGVYVPSEALLKRVCVENEKVYDTCWNGDKIVIKECENNRWEKVSSCPIQTGTPGQNLDTGTGGSSDTTTTQEDYDFVNERVDNAVDEDIIDIMSKNKISTIILSFGAMLCLISGINLVRGKK